MDHSQHSNADPQELEHAKEMWDNFAVFGKYTIYATCAILIGLALAFVKFF